ncbi:MAG: hypothetical protein CVV24_11065 [Ignavibacteriae bacterium HGW-Ignavibacteriae-3]|nr:MAG: hypothetical protein CVV24_11065 [Ignavibacteriae bacterium HGW-Ignavibacteriae-3]
MKKILTLSFICILMVGSTYAGGFQTGTQNARAMGMGHAFVGMATDASAIYFNPAGLTNLKGTNILFGSTFIMPKVKFTGPTPATVTPTTPVAATTETVARTFTPINFYASHSMDNGLSFGIGVFNPYGLGSEWPSTWVGKSLAVKTELRTFYINPTVAYKVTESLSIAAGFNYIISNVQFYQVIDIPTIPLAPGVNLPGAANVGVNLEGNGKAAYTWNVGFLLKPTNTLSLGAAYRHSAEITFNGDLVFSGLNAKPTGFPVGHSDLFPAGPGVAKLTMPWDLRFGASWNASDNLTLNFDLQYVGWSSYQELAADFEKNTAAWADLKSIKSWGNTVTFRFGGEYTMNDWAFRAGFVRDGSPSPSKYMDPSLPGADRSEFTFGVGYQITKTIRVDAAYQYISFDKIVTDSAVRLPTGQYFNGTYTNSTNLFGLNFGFNF